IDINPLAIKISNAKTQKINDDALRSLIGWLQRKAKESESPRSVELFAGSDKWFRKDVSFAISNILDKIAGLDEETRNFAEVGLSSILKGISNARMDRTIPTLPKTVKYYDFKHNRDVDNEKRELNVYSRLAARLRRMQYALKEFHLLAANDAPCIPILGDSRKLTKHLSERGVDRVNLIVTSPPYWNAQDYQGMHALSFKLFGLKMPGDLEIGQDGKGYLGDMRLFIREVARILDGKIAFVIGEARDGTHEELFRMFIDEGFEELQSIKRKITMHAFFAKGVKNEYIYVFQNSV
ncbi:MAG: hypothetical protein QXH91_05740, partial [Candidatus Bathyarchaeia archaeon]